METKSVYFVSLGCPKNLVDSQVMLGSLKNDNYTIAQNPSEAEVIIVNTCSFIQASKEESVDTILEMADQKINGNCKILVASGCMPQRYSKEMQKEMPEIDLLIGTGQYHKITEALAELKKDRALGDPIPSRVYVDQPAFIHTENDARIHTGPKYSGYLKLSEGCNRRCAFCIIPKLRGNVRSRTVASLVEEASMMAAQGVRELNLVAQDLTEYGMEWKYKERLETLLPELAKIEGIEWIRLHYVYPDQFSDELVDIIAREPKIVKYLDMPIQHTNDLVLKNMNRRLTKVKLFDLITKLRAKIPNIVFRTSIIVGFPRETESDFGELCKDLDMLKLDHVGVFRYSKEEGTKAAEMSEQVHPSVKRRRYKTLTSILEKNQSEMLTSYLGRTVEAMIEGTSEETDLLIKARMTTQAQDIDGHILINDLGDFENITPGDIIQVELTDVVGTELMGRIVGMVKPFEGESREYSYESSVVQPTL
ncbi:MAG: 30S ribosomal protein S12 methylthiotransferase RimO [Xanthomonadaceae bacterium]|nr:30S ribosomal protein S12 methylthiotransferase RimO [Xanthomonadaceae bacterium]